MIFVTVGTHEQGFDRLVKKMDELVRDKKIKDKVIIQTGYTDYKPKACKWFKFVDPQDFEQLCKKSDIIITHAGVGSIMTSLKFGKRTIVVPRLKKFAEHRDDHQLQITKELEKQKRILGVYDINELECAIKKLKRKKQRREEQKPVMIIKMVNEKLKEWV